MRFIVFCILMIFTCCSAAHAQHDSSATRANSNGILNTIPPVITHQDSVAIAKEIRKKLMEDSIAMFYLVPDSSLRGKITFIKTNDLLDVSSQSFALSKQTGDLKTGNPRHSRDQWVIAVVIGLLFYTGLLNFFLGKDIRSVLQSFYNKNALSQLDKEGGLVNSWAFIGLFLLFSLTAGLVLYQLTVFYDRSYSIAGFPLFVWLSVIVGVLFALKFIVLKFIGFVFDINRMVSEYIAVLNLSYFNIAFVLLSVAICFSLLSSQFIPFLLFCTLALIVVIFAWQYLRNSVNIISDFRFHKFYLFIYLCALEICPVLILIKALNI